MLVGRKSAIGYWVAFYIDYDRDWKTLYFSDAKYWFQMYIICIFACCDLDDH